MPNIRTGKETLLFLSAAEGFALGGMASFLSFYVVESFLYILTGFYTALRVGKINHWVFVPVVTLGSFAVKAFNGTGLNQSLLFAVDMTVLPLTVLAVFGLLYWSNFFATNEPHLKSFWLTCFWAVIGAVAVYLVNPSPVLVMVAPLLWASLIPLWCFDLRLLHALLFASVYLFLFWLSSLLIMPGHPVKFMVGSPLNWLAVILLVAVPEMILCLHPERRHVPESRPVTSSSLSDWEKFVGLKEVLMLGLSFYSMYAEKFGLVRRCGSLGRYFIIMGILLEFYPLLGSWQPLPLWCSILPVTAGILLELALENYGVFALWTIQYSAALGLIRVSISSSGKPGILVLAGMLLLLALVIWFNRPADNTGQGKRWKESGRSGEERVGL
ncbi:MAG: hypothetical protein VR69_14185 [Peptococcaceae bacterium BRH_c4b]|nr:MAG: hypothetical protein VR69_14185 [Peptococcaceae bacterium BRH_c4b]